MKTLKQINEDYTPKVEDITKKVNDKAMEVKELEEFILEQPKVEQERDDWREMVEEQQAAHKKILEDIEKDKIHQIDNLRKEMLLQIRNVKVKMLNMNEDQLVGTTRLTVSQNAQLTGELEY